MHAARSLSAKPTGRPVGDHPKDKLYDGVYDPLTAAWFAALADSPEVPRLMAEAPEHGLLDNLQRFNRLFHDLVDVSIDRQHEKDLADMVAVVHTHRETVWWMGYMTPGPEAGPEELRASLGGKLKRNISLGVVEALICLESAYHYCRQAPLHLTGEALAATLRRSRQLYASLALLHDEQERERLTFLTGIEGYLTYPTVDYHHVIGGQVRVPADKFLVAGTAEEPRVRFVIPPLHSAVLDSPTKRCPAHRLRSAQHPEMALNDVLWDLLIEIYRQSGRFA